MFVPKGHSSRLCLTCNSKRLFFVPFLTVGVFCFFNYSVIIDNDAKYIDFKSNIRDKKISGNAIVDHSNLTQTTTSNYSNSPIPKLIHEKSFQITSNVSQNEKNSAVNSTTSFQKKYSKFYNNETLLLKTTGDEDVFDRRRRRIDYFCKKFNIKRENRLSDWTTTECVAEETSTGINECIAPSHFALARSSSSMTCLLNKVASSSLVSLFLDSIKNGPKPSGKIFEESPHAYISFLKPKTDYEFTLAKRQYFKFLFVRDPFERLLSAYLDKVVNADHWSLLEFRQYINNFTFSQTKINNSSDEKSLNGTTIKHGIPTFKEFLHYILHSSLNGEGFGSHWVPYWKWCAPCSMDYDAIVKLTEHDTAMKRIWLRMKIDYRKVKIPWINNSGLQQRMKQMKRRYYSTLSLNLIKEVHQRFFVDFLLFDFDISEVLLYAGYCNKRQHCRDKFLKD